jgi:hypothetical protein
MYTYINVERFFGYVRLATYAELEYLVVLKIFDTSLASLFELIHTGETFIMNCFFLNQLC